MTMQQLDLIPTINSAARKADILMKVARSVTVRLKSRNEISRQDLTGLMEDAFGASDASGAWSMRDAYDAAEVAQVLLQLGEKNDVFTPGSPQSSLGAIEGLSYLLPTQTYRSEAQVALQQFSTPAPLAFVAGCAAAIGKGDTVIEPSAGTGLLAVHAVLAGARVMLNELDDHRAALLALVFPRQELTRHDAAQIHDHIREPASVVLMNPPYSKSAGIGDDAYAGARHLRAALMTLVDGGRCVAIMPSWFSPDASGAAGYAAVAKVVPPAFDMLCDGNFYAKHGTGISVRILVYDKGRKSETVRAVATHYSEALRKLDLLPQRLPFVLPTTKLAPQIAITPTIKPAARTSGLLASSGAKKPMVPRPPQLDLNGGDACEIPYTPRSEIRASDAPVGIYVPYRVARIDFDNAVDHPTPLVESLAMASIAPPPANYRPKLPLIASRALSAAQLETLIYAGQSFERDLHGRYNAGEHGLELTEHADGAAYRAGFFLGDGTGAGKGRQVAGIVMDQWSKGNRRHVWVSKSAALLEDARRDWAALGGIGIDIQTLTDWGLGDPVTMDSGILFTTYATLRSSRPDKGSRIDQILTWLGAGDADATAPAPAFEGLIVFDEAHAMANAAGSASTRGPVKGSEQGICGVRLQHLPPRARILYVSATGATDIANLAYATRLGLWGTGTAFESREIFMTQMREGGMAAMELVARDLKALGLTITVARSN